MPSISGFSLKKDKDKLLPFLPFRKLTKEEASTIPVVEDDEKKVELVEESEVPTTEDRGETEVTKPKRKKKTLSG